MVINWRRRFLWSRERQKAWDFCLRSYYYRYLAEWEEHAQKDLIQKLNSLLLWPELKKNIFLNLIAMVVERKDTSKIREQLKENLAQILSQPDKILLPREIESLSLEKALEELDGLLKNFISLYQNSFGRIQFLRAEEKFYYRGIPMLVNPNFIFISDEGIILSKLEISKSEQDNLARFELCSHILWVQENYNFIPEKIKYELIYLEDCEVEEVYMTGEELSLLVSEILNRAQKMLLIQNSNELYPSPSLEKCKTCRFFSLCPDSLYQD